MQFAFNSFPRNSDFREVLLKVAVLNEWYNTNLRQGDKRRDVAHRIVGLDFDRRIRSRELDLALVDELASGPSSGLDYRLSFATKYCYWARAVLVPGGEVYPIFDSNAERAVYRISKRLNLTSQTGRRRITHESLWEIRVWTRVLANLLLALGLEDAWNYRQLDKGLYELGAVLEHRRGTQDWKAAVGYVGHKPPAWLWRL